MSRPSPRCSTGRSSGPACCGEASRCCPAGARWTGWRASPRPRCCWSVAMTCSPPCPSRSGSAGASPTPPHRCSSTAAISRGSRNPTPSLPPLAIGSPPGGRRSVGNDERRPASEMGAAGLAGDGHLEVDESLPVFLALVTHHAGIGEDVAGPGLLTPLHLEAAHVGRAEPVGGPGGEDAGLAHAHGEGLRETRLLGEPGVVVDRVHVVAILCHELHEGHGAAPLAF